MLVCVDGTGPSDDAEYGTVFANSFVNRVKHAYLRSHPQPDPAPIHHRGPGDTFDDDEGYVGTFGGQHHVDPMFVVDEIMAVQDRLSEQVEEIPSWTLRQPVSAWPPDDSEALDAIGERRKVFLVGHSRGGGILIHAARILRVRGVPVEAMFLFDAVSRNPLLDAAVIPPNVRYCYHAVRDPRSHSRGSFGNCGSEAHPVVHFDLEPFMTTHGGMGGTPWGDTPGHITASGYIAEGDPMGPTVITPAQEVLGMQAVERWMWPRLRRHHVVP